ncbi:MAG: transcription-repair coupling factor [Thermoanaerobaculum sp.]|nr:transcription-repair coupling factor [Thermoanaerobaculum sp.]MDW7967010.1 transcription-repair coupling factor [Thermoanaerobaculum sp.]
MSAFPLLTEALSSYGAPSPRRVAGVCPGARVVGVELVLGGLPRAVVVVPTPNDAQELAAAYSLFFPEKPVGALPAHMVLPYAPQGAPLGAVAEGLWALWAWAEGQLQRLIVPARLLPIPFPRLPDLQGRCGTLAPGQRVDLRHLAKVLAREGFRRVEVVEEAGEFALRGEVLDVGTAQGFFRLLVEVDRLEAVRTFDPKSQRSCTEESGFTFLPMTLFPTNPQVLAEAAKRLEERGFFLLAQLLAQEPPSPLAVPFLSLALPHQPLWELAEGLVVVEPAGVEGELERTWTALARAHQSACRTLPLPEPEQWLSPPARCREALASAPVVEELEGLPRPDTLRLRTQPPPALASRPQVLVEEVRRGFAQRHTQVLVAGSAGEAERLAHLLRDHQLPFRAGFPEAGGIGIVRATLGRGFCWPQLGLTVFGRNDLTSLPPPPPRTRTLAQVFFDLRDLKVGDFVVHRDHGIGRFLGFRTVLLDGTRHECVELEYAGGAKLLVPLERADLLEKYTAGEAAAPRLDRLGGSTWSATKARVRKALRDLAEELLRVAALRELTPGYAFAKDGPWQREFEAAFEWELTPDQEQAVAEVKRDMESPRPMDRLLVGDVGYGKTEVAMRAAFKAVMDGKQVAVLAPTTVLAEQHFRTFTRRFAGFPVEIRMLSRFLPQAEQRQVVKGLEEGTVDLVVGTHRLLASDVRFRDLGLLIIDEEQRFGVAQKEKLKKLKANVDVLSMSATPIPRTLNLGLLGLRDVSIIETPPRDRLAVQTHVVPFDPEIIREAIELELAREGQVFFVHNRVTSLPAMAKFLRELVPEARIVTAHGQMAERELERAMDAFFERRADVLLATAIVENGLDVPNANTLIVNRADRFGLAQLYQLRGRVGRSDRLAFAYLLVPPDEALSQEARSRLAAILEFAELGAGFRVAARDLEIRGAGNILGAEQHGHLHAVGYETYCRLLEETVAELKGQPLPAEAPAVELHLGLDLRIPDTYVAEETLRFSLYRRIAMAQTAQQLAALAEELADRFGPLPAQVHNLLQLQGLRLAAQLHHIRRIRKTPKGVELSLDPTAPTSHWLALHLLARLPEGRLAPSGTLTLPSLPLATLRELLETATPKEG